MAELIKINVDFRYQPSGVILKIPQEIKVPVGSIVQWNIVELANYPIQFPFYRSGLIFTLYFSDDSPFRWKRQFRQPHYDPDFYRLRQGNVLRLAEDVADLPGNFKYGVKVTNPESEEDLFDEDPYLIVY